MQVSEAQQDLRQAYVGGGPGVVVSGAIWLAASWIQHSKGVGIGFAALFVGGMLIFPISKLLCRFVFHRQNEARDNPFGMTVLECTIAMIAGLFAAWLFLPSRPELVFPLAAIAVGTHYFVFKTAYGDRAFWLLATIITAIGLGDIYATQMHGWSASLVAATELIFGLGLTVRATAGSRSV
jgi:hypothetical protein